MLLPLFNELQNLDHNQNILSSCGKAISMSGHQRLKPALLGAREKVIQHVIVRTKTASLINDTFQI